MATKTRLDILMVERGLAESRSKAQRLVMAGQVRVDGQVTLRSAATITPSSTITVEQSPRFVSRGGEKLEAALQAFGFDVSGKICADVGASTGGFTDCLLQHGAARVYAIDVGRGILDWKLRQDHRVVVMEGTNARFVERLPERMEVITIDAAFISLKVLLEAVKDWFSVETDSPQGSEGSLIALVKPQFEVGRQLAGRGKGVIRDPVVHRQVLLDVLGFAAQEGYAIRGLVRSPLFGPKGNVEFLAWLEFPGEGSTGLVGLIDEALKVAR